MTNDAKDTTFQLVSTGAKHWELVESKTVARSPRGCSKHPE